MGFGCFSVGKMKLVHLQFISKCILVEQGTSCRHISIVVHTQQQVDLDLPKVLSEHAQHSLLSCHGFIHMAACDGVVYCLYPCRFFYSVACSVCSDRN